MAETFLREADGGAVAVWSPTTMGRNSGHAILNNGLFKAIFNDYNNILGSAINQAKSALLIESGNDYLDLIQTYTLFGDPALSMKAKKKKVVVKDTPAASDPATVFDKISKSIIKNSDNSQKWRDSEKESVSVFGNIVNHIAYSDIKNRLFSDNEETTEAEENADGENSFGNTGPVAKAGRDLYAETGKPVRTDGMASYDPDENALSFYWSFATVPYESSITNASIRRNGHARSVFTPDVEGLYVLQLTVSDGEIEDSDTVSVYAYEPNRAPVANAGSDKAVFMGVPVFLNGSLSLDSDNGPEQMTYRWTISEKPIGSLLNDAGISNSASALAVFTPDVIGSYVFTLEVSDGELSDSAEVFINVNNNAPVANAGSDWAVLFGKTVHLDGGHSLDYDKAPKPLTFRWTISERPDGSKLSDESISNRRSARAFFTPDVRGYYVLTLEVSDGELSDADYVSITVRNYPPLPDARKLKYAEMVKKSRKAEKEASSKE
jgi:hypothetical protein